MSLKQVLAQAGATEIYPFNSLFENWVTASRKAENNGLAANAIRIGTKRVVIATDRRVRRSLVPVLVPLLVCALPLGVFYGLNKPKPGERNNAPVVTCLPFSTGDLFQVSGSKASIRDWDISFKTIGTLGSLQKYEVSANCGNRTWLGQVTVNAAGNRKTVKKLTPTKR